MIKVLLCILVINSAALFCQENSEPITITGDSLVGKVINGQSVREVYGNVVIHQSDIVITCNKAIQYILENSAILEGNVVVTQDTLVIKTPKGYYDGDEKIAEGHNGIELNDGKVILTAVNGIYFFNDEKALFSDSVKLYDTVSTLTSNKLTYFKTEQKVIAVGEVSIKDSINIIEADSLVHLRDEKITFAEKNVLVVNAGNNTKIYGNHLEDYSKRKYTLVTDQPLLIQIDSTQDGKVDTLVISAILMESFNDSTQKFIATDSVRIIQSGLASKNNTTIYFRNEDKIITYLPKEKIDDNSESPSLGLIPVLWYEGTQFSGDSISIFLSEKKLNKIEIIEKAFILSQNESVQTNKRSNQISGDTVNVYFDSTGINYADVDGNVLSIHYIYEGKENNGLNKASSQSAKIHFVNNEVNEIRLYIQAISEYYPENLVEGNELTFTLPTFPEGTDFEKIDKDKPKKEELFKIENSRFSLTTEKKDSDISTINSGNKNREKHE